MCNNGLGTTALGLAPPAFDEPSVGMLRIEKNGARRRAGIWITALALAIPTANLRLRPPRRECGLLRRY